MTGTVCWLDAGIVIRGPATALEEGTFYLDAPGTVLVRVFDARGAVLVDGVRFDALSDGKRIDWSAPQPNGR